MLSLKITNTLSKELKAYNTVGPTAVKKTYDYFKSITPKQTGNARNHTKLDKTTIVADYDYAGRLDEGWSKQAPNGMTKPSIDKLVKFVEQDVKSKG